MRLRAPSARRHPDEVRAAGTGSSEGEGVTSVKRGASQKTAVELSPSTGPHRHVREPPAV
jgi:hypothetical protein